ncbi:MAG TPA: hypothetical protein PKV08_04555 [Candidatus Syntrophosphaera thermopropionivorans]|nr:hypothetical protein [Candidatus Syntrophosphaera thermopropionivorans]
MRKFFIAVLMLIVLLAGCKSSVQSNKVKVIFWHGISGPLGETLNNMISEFNKTHKDIEVIANPISSYNALSQKLMASIQANINPILRRYMNPGLLNILKQVYCVILRTL